MSIFNPTLETQIQPEQAVRAPEQYSPIAAIADAGSKFLRATAKSSSNSAAARQNALDARLGSVLDVELQKREQGLSYDKTAVKKATIDFVAAGGTASDDLKTLYEGLVNEPFDALFFKDEQEYRERQLMEQEGFQSLARAVKAGNPDLTEDEVREKVMLQMNNITLLNQEVALAEAKIAAGQTIEATPIVASIQSDFKILAAEVAAIRKDTVVTKAEYDNALIQVRSLITSKYAAFGENPQVKAVQDQMFALLDDIGKGVSQDQIDIQLDAVQIALQNKGFNPAVIATIRSMVKTEPKNFETILQKELGKDGTSLIDGLVDIWNALPEETKLENFFGDGSRPTTNGEVGGKNVSLIDIPSVSENPQAYETVVAGFSEITGSVDPNKIVQNETTRNEWLKTMNITASAVASQSDEYILGEKLLSKFASNGVVGNLDAVYRTDPLNAAQTNDALQQALAAERIRNDNELNQRLNSGDAEYFKMSESGELVLDTEKMRSKIMEAYEGGNTSMRDRRLADQAQFEADVAAAGGLEKIMALPQSQRDEILGNSPIPNLIGTRFGSTLKLVKNMKLIDTKLGSLTALEEKYTDATRMFRGVTVAQEAVEAVNATKGTVGSVTGQLIDGLEAGSGGYRALFAQAQDDKGGPFEGYDVTTKTLGELYEFSKPSGASGTYGAFVKANNPEGDLATPMGRYQFVGTTLRETAKRMGLPDETVFTPAVQDSMFLFLARDVIKGKSQEGKRKALRGTWAGFKKASDTQLNQMISEIENEDFNLGGDIITTPEVTTTELPQSASPMAVTTSLRPQERPAEPEQIEAGDQGIVRVVNSPVFDRDMQRFLQALKIDTDQAFFVADLDELEAAEAAGKLKKGDKVVVGAGAEALVVEIE